jgi:hypothetical protein
MIKILFLLLCMISGLVANAQTSGADRALVASAPMTPDLERVRINAERVKLEAGFNLEIAACITVWMKSSQGVGIRWLIYADKRSP